MTREEAYRLAMRACEKTWNEKTCKQIKEALEQEPCENCISFEAVKNTMFMVQRTAFISDNEFHRTMDLLMRLPSVQPKHTDAEIQKMQEMEQAEIQKAYELGKAEMQLSEDCISRQAAIDKKELVELEDGQSFYCISPEDVETLPSVTPQPKTGHWIVDSATSSQIGIHGKKTFSYEVHCDKCRWKWAYATDKKDSIPSNYCPNCGAKMVEPQESEDKE